MKKFIVAVLVMFMLIGGVTPVYAEDATLAWDPPTHRIVGTDCTTQGAAITAAELATLEYTLSYRVKGATAWVSISTNVPTTTLTGLPYNTTYQAIVGARWPGGTISCTTPIMEFKTSAGPQPGGCRNLRATVQ